MVMKCLIASKLAGVGLEIQDGFFIVPKLVPDFRYHQFLRTREGSSKLYPVANRSLQYCANSEGPYFHCRIERIRVSYVVCLLN